MKGLVKKLYFWILINSLFIQSVNAGILFNLDNPRFSKNFIEAIESANENLSKKSTESFGGAPVACEVSPAGPISSNAPIVTISGDNSTLKTNPLVADVNKGVIPYKENAVVDSFQIIDESNFSCNALSKVQVIGSDGKKIKSVCPEFLDTLAIHGLGKLEDGRVLQLSKSVQVEKTVGGKKQLLWEKRFALADPNCPYGQTFNGVCLEPYRSIIVSKQTGFQPGDVVYFEDFRDIIIPPGVKHGGYFIVAAVKNTDENRKPEVSVFIGPDTHEKNALLSSVQAYKKDGLKLAKVTGEAKKDAELFINDKRKMAREVLAQKVSDSVDSSRSPTLSSSLGTLRDNQNLSNEKKSLNQNGWNDKYTDYIADAISDDSPLLNLNSDEINLLCPRFTQMNPSEKKIFWAYFFKALSVPESGTNPYTGFVERGSRHSDGDLALRKVAGETVKKTSEGLLQLSYQDALSEGNNCDFDYKKDYPVFKEVIAARDGAGSQSMDLEALVEKGYLNKKHLSAAKRLDIYDPKKNLQCGVKILENQLGIPRPLFDDKIYYWSALNTENEDSSNKVKSELAKSSALCSVNYLAPNIAKKDEIIPDSVPQGYESGQFTISLSENEKKNIAKSISKNKSAIIGSGKVEEMKRRIENDSEKIANFHNSSNYDGPAVSNGEELTSKMKMLMNDLAKDPRGRYAMIDYLDFKGDGLNNEERVRDTNGKKTNVGFGLYQVLASAAAEYDGTQDAANLFAKHSNLVLENRIQVSDRNPNDKNGVSKYRSSWAQRTTTYDDAIANVPDAGARVPATTTQPGSSAAPIDSLPPVTTSVALSSDQPFANEGKLVWEGKFPEVNCEEWGLSGANFCYPEPGRIVLNPSHSEGQKASRRNERDDGHNGYYFHEGRMNVATSLVIKSAIDKCLTKQDASGEKKPQVRLSRWPGEHYFGTQEFGRGLAGEIQSLSPAGGRVGYINQYLLGDGQMDSQIASKSLLICIDYNAGLGYNDKSGRDYSLAIKPKSSRWNDDDDSHDINESMASYMEMSMAGYLEGLSTNSPVRSISQYKDNSRVVDETHTNEGIGMFGVGNNGTKHSTIEGFFMDGVIGKRVSDKIKSDNPNNYYEFSMRKLVYDKGRGEYVKSNEVIDPNYRLTQEHLMVARGVALGIMNNEEYQCQQ